MFGLKRVVPVEPEVERFDFSSIALTKPNNHELRPYQVKAAQTLVGRERHYLADAPGVGKTPPTIVALATIGFPDTLIVCPKKAIGVWESHLEEMYGVKAKTFVANKAKNADVKSPGILITNYEQMESIIELREHWPVIIFDEAHKLRNRKTKAYKTAKYFTSSYLWLLSGTPVFKGAHDLWAPLAMLVPQQFPAYWPFVNKYCFQEKSWGGVNVYGIQNPMRLAADIAPYFTRRLKKHVLPELPEKMRMKIPLHMTPRQKKAYIELVKTMMTEGDDGSLVLNQSGAVRDVRLRELLVSPRLLGIDDDGIAIPALLDALDERETPTLVSTPFRDGVKYIGEYLRAEGWEVHELMGGLPDKVITDRVMNFQKGTTKKRVLVSTVGMGESWTATAAEQFYAVGYDWAPQINNQMEDRMNRFGGTGYECYYFCHLGTIDESVLEVNAGKVTIENLTMNHRLIIDVERM